MKVLITGGAGFTGRWVVKEFLEKGNEVFALDNLSNSNMKNIKEFENNKKFKFLKGDIKNKNLISALFKKNKFDTCIHLAASINVQESIDNPKECFENNIMGTFNILEACRKTKTKLVFMSSALVYDTMKNKAIDELHATKSASPYMASKIMGENLVLSYYYSYGLPIVILRPFSIYGPFQKSNQEGGVMSIFIKRKLDGKKLEIFGDGEQSRDFLYVEDCANFIYRTSTSKKAVGEIINAGSGKDIKIKELAFLICKNKNKIKYVKHHHPQAEIKKMVCNCSKAKKLLGWKPKVSLREGIKRTENWIKRGIDE